MKTIHSITFLLIFLNSFAFAEIHGDINQDGKIDLTEAVHALKITSGIPSEIISPPAQALPGKTGQTTQYEDGDDGNLQIGIADSGVRFTDNNDGTVTDNRTRLIWLKNANVTGDGEDWSDAFSDISELNSAGTMNGNPDVIFNA